MYSCTAKQASGWSSIQFSPQFNHRSLHEQHHYPCKSGRYYRISHNNCHPLDDQSLFRNIGLQVLGSGNSPCLGVSNPVPVDKKSVKQTFCHREDINLKEGVPESSGSVNTVDCPYIRAPATTEALFWSFLVNDSSEQHAELLCQLPFPPPSL